MHLPRTLQKVQLLPVETRSGTIVEVEPLVGGDIDKLSSKDLLGMFLDV